MATETRRRPRPAGSGGSARRSTGRRPQPARTTGRRSARPPTAWTREAAVIAGLALGLLALGLVMTLSASFVEAARDAGDPFAIARRQAIFAAIGLPLGVTAALVGPHRLRPLAWPLLLAALALSTVVLFVGAEVHGARRWLSLGPVGMQPSELLKLAVPLVCASTVARRWPRVRRGDLKALLLPSVPIIALSTAVVLAGPDLETALLVAAAGGVVLLVAGLPGRLLAAGLGAAAAVAGAAVAVAPFRRLRLEAWLDPAAHAADIGYQSMQGYIALGSGGVLGRGLGQGRGQWLFVPNAHTDFIYAIIGEELGLVGALGVLAAFAALTIAGVRAARRAPDPFGRLLATGLVLWLAAQATMNMGSVVGALPVTGVTLPLVSFGGTSLIVTLVAMGLLVGVARTGRPPPAPADSDPRVDEPAS